MLLKISWRNIWRHKLRSFTIIASIIIGVWAGAFMMSFYYAMANQRVKSAIENEVSHLQIHHPEFKAEHDVKFIIPNGSDIVEKLNHRVDIKSAAGRFIAMGMVSSPAGSSGIQINGVNPFNEKNVTGLNKKLTQGEYFKDSVQNLIIISEKLSKKMKVKLHSKLIVTFQDKDANIVAGAFRITGLFKTINGPYDAANIFLNVTDVNTLLNTKNEINEIAVLLNDINTLDTKTISLQKEYSSLSIEKWSEISPEVGLVINSIDEYMDIFMVIIMLAISFGIVNIMLMSVLERTREIGMLMSIGMNKRKLFFMILAETVFLILISCPAGLLISYLTINYFGNEGISLKYASEVYSSFGYDLITYPKLELASYIRIAIFVIVTAIISSLFPARKALRLKPAESIRKL